MSVSPESLDIKWPAQIDDDMRAGQGVIPFLLGALLAAAPLQAQEDKGIEWAESLPDALDRAGSTGKPIVAAFFAEWCGACRRFRSETLPDRGVLSLRDRFEWVRIDLDRNLAVARSYDVKATPEFCLMDASGTVRARIRGALGPEEFRAELNRFLEHLPREAAGKPPRLVLSEKKADLALELDGYRGRAICFSNVGYGPLRLPSQSPFQSLRQGLLPRAPSTLSQGNIELHETETWANLWARNEGDWLIDAETLQSHLSIAYGVTDTLQFEISAEDKSRFGGAMDAFVQEFHDLLNIDQGGRDEVSRDRFSAEFATTPGTPPVRLTNRHRGSYSRSLATTFQHNVTCGTPDLPAIAYSATLRTDLGDVEDLTDEEPTDLAVSLSVAKRFGDFYLYLNAGYAWFGKEEFRGIDLKTTQGSALLALEWRFAAEMSLLAQYLLSEGVTEHLGRFSEPSHEITLGWKGEILRGTVLEVGLIENVIVSDNSPDFGLHAGISLRF